MPAPVPGTAIAHTGNPTTSATITLGTTAANTILILVGVNAGATAALTPGGTYNGGAWNATGLAAAMTASWGGSWWSRCTGNHSGQTITLGTATDSISAMVLPITGAETSGSPLDTNTSATTLTANGLALAAFTTTVANTLIIYAGAWDDNIAASAVTKGGTNMNLAQASSTGGADSGVMIANLAQAAAGSTGAFAGTHASALSKRLMAFAVKEPSAAPQTVNAGVASEDDSAPAATLFLGALGTIISTDTNKYGSALGGQSNGATYGGSTLGATPNTTSYP